MLSSWIFFFFALFGDPENTIKKIEMYGVVNRLYIFVFLVRDLTCGKRQKKSV